VLAAAAVLLPSCRHAIVCLQSDRPVWQQLCDRLDNSPVLSAQRLQQHKQDKEQLQEQLEQMQKRITDLEEENADLQQQLHKRQA
jgi:TolA-binding protein